MIVTLEGLPGVGKTSTAHLLADRLKGQLVCETTHNHPFLGSVYRDDERYDLEVELAFLLLHSSAWRRIDRSSMTVTDFSPVKDVLFADDMLANHNDRTLFDHAYSRLYDGYSPPDVVIYLDLAPELCLERVRRRYAADSTREFEKGLTLDRLVRMESLYKARLDQLGGKVQVLEVEGILRSGDTETESKDRVADAVLGLLSLER